MLGGKVLGFDDSIQRRNTVHSEHGLPTQLGQQTMGTISAGVYIGQNYYLNQVMLMV